MGTNLRILHDHLGRTLTLAATSAATGFPATNLETGNRHAFWVASSAVEQTLTYDAGAGETRPVDYVVLPRADLLVAAGASVVVQWSADASTNWTNAFTALAPILTSDLAQPTGTDYVKEFTPLDKRGWRTRIYGTLSAAPSLAGGYQLGALTELGRNPKYGRTLGIARTDRGAEFTGQWGHLLEAPMEALLSALAAITPAWPAESLVETSAGGMWGGLPHYLYDPAGTVFRHAGIPWLLPVLCLTPEAAESQVRALGVEEGPTMRWRERR